MQSEGMRLQNWATPGISRRSRAVIAALGWTWRPLTAVLPHNRASLRMARAVIAAGLRVGSPKVAGAKFTRVEQTNGDGLIVRGEWVNTPHTTRTDGAILFLHGSGYVVCSSRTHRGLTSHLSQVTGLPLFSIDYRLAPSHQYPAAPQDARAAWDWLVAQGYEPGRIVIAGDSAGGHLAITLGLELARQGQPLPAAIVTMSPIIDLSLKDAIVRDRMETDPFVAAAAVAPLLSQYADQAAQADDGLQITFEDIEEFPPTLIHVGSREMLAADCTELARRITAAGFEVQYRVWPGQMHVFQAMTALLPESKVALEEIGEFVAHHLPPMATGTANPKRFPAEVAA